MANYKASVHKSSLMVGNLACQGLPGVPGTPGLHNTKKTCTGVKRGKSVKMRDGISQSALLHIALLHLHLHLHLHCQTQHPTAQSLLVLRTLGIGQCSWQNVFILLQQR